MSPRTKSATLTIPLPHGMTIELAPDNIRRMYAVVDESGEWRAWLGCYIGGAHREIETTVPWSRAMELIWLPKTETVES